MIPGMPVATKAAVEGQMKRVRARTRLGPIP